MRKPRSTIYFDYAATTPVDKEVLRAMEPYFGVKFGNAGSLHSFGQEAVAALDRAREDIARSIGAGFREIVFTGSATESNNLALRGAVRGFRKETAANPRPKIIVSAIEHESVIETARDLEREGVAEVVVVPVDPRGVVDMKKLRAALDKRTALVSVMYANNEIGVIQPIKEIAGFINEYRMRNESTNKAFVNSQGNSLFVDKPLFHTDAAQAFQFLDCNADALGVDLMTLSAHKIYGPKGVGALYMRRQRANSKEQIASNPPLAISHLPFAAVTTGGGQEFGLRSGTENIPSIVGFAKAVELASARRAAEAERIGALMRHFLGGLKKIYPRLAVNGHPSVPPLLRGEGGGGVMRLPNILNIWLPGKRAESLLMKWDLAGLAVSAGSACSARSYEPSRVLQALGHSRKRAQESVRFSFGVLTTKDEIDKALRIILEVL